VDPKSLLDRWIGRPSPSPDLTSALEDLARLGLDRPDLTEAARSLAALMIAAFDGADLLTVIDPEAMMAGWSAGLPAF
jgi:hypothetical protein